MWYKECGLNVATIGILQLSIEQLIEDFHIVVVDGIVKRQHYHLGNIFSRQTSWYFTTTYRAETLRQPALFWVTIIGPVRIIPVVTQILITAIRAVNFIVTKQGPWQTHSISTGQLSTVTAWVWTWCYSQSPVASTRKSVCLSQKLIQEDI